MNDDDFVNNLLKHAQTHDANISRETIQSVLSAITMTGYVAVPVQPSIGLLVSMATRYDHSFGAPQIDIFFGHTLGHTRESREALITSMQQIHEEVVGVGFYHPNREETYKRILKQ